MKTFPMFFQMSGKKVVIVGGGEQAAQKTRLMLKTEARIVILTDELEDELISLANADRIEHQSGQVSVSDFADTAMVFIASGCPGADRAIHTLAKAAGAVVNGVDQPSLCDIITPSLVDRDPVVVAIGTEGTAPVLARQIKTQVEQMLEPGLGDLAALAGRLRDSAAARLAPRVRRDLWRWVFNGSPRQRHGAGAHREAAQMIKQAIKTGEFGQDKVGSVALVGAGPGAKDLITLRGVQRLQEADVIYYDRLVDPEILELARRDAERVYVGKSPGCHSWPQEKITETLVAAARKGQRIVRLKCGDPGIFARSCEEISALEGAGVPFEIVPGVTAATGAAAAAAQPLTERGAIDTLTLTTGHLKTGGVLPDCLKTMRPGACVSLYMSVGAAPQIAAYFRSQSLEAHIDATIVARAQTPEELVLSCEVSGLPEVLSKNGISDTAMIILKWRKAAGYSNVVPLSHSAALAPAG